MQDTALSLMMLAAVALIAGAIYLWVKRGERKRPLLMLALALVMGGNIAILVLPDERGQTLSSDTPAAGMPAAHP